MSRTLIQAALNQLGAKEMEKLRIEESRKALKNRLASKSMPEIVYALLDKIHKLEDRVSYLERCRNYYD